MGRCGAGGGGRLLHSAPGGSAEAGAAWRSVQEVGAGREAALTLHFLNGAPADPHLRSRSRRGVKEAVHAAGSALAHVARRGWMAGAAED